MKKHINYILLFAIAVTLSISACKKTDYTFGKIITPSGVVITTTIQGSAANATGDGSGIVKISVKAQNALAYKIYFGNSAGDSALTTTGDTTFKYTTLDTNNYTITVNAIGTGGAITTTSKQIRVLYQFQIPADILANLTGGSSKNWQIAPNTAGNFGVGPSGTFSPDYYSSPGNDKPACAYAGTITFTKVGDNSISINVDNQGQSFLIGAATGFYGQTGGDGCYVVNTGGTKTIGPGAGDTGPSGTGFVFSVPGNGLVNFGTGATTYQVLTLTANTLALRNIGIDGNAWYQILQAE